MKNEVRFQLQRLIISLTFRDESEGDYWLKGEAQIKLQSQIIPK